MAPFSTPKQIVASLKEKAESLCQHGDRLYVGTSTGNLFIYEVNNTTGEHGDTGPKLIDTRKGLVRRAIDQLGFIREINSLIVLSEMTVTLFPVQGFSPPTVLVKAKAAFSFGLHTAIQHSPASVPVPGKDVSTPPSTTIGLPGSFAGGSFADTGAAATNMSIPSVVTQLVVGCRRKVVIYTWKDGEAQEIKEAAIPHSPRAIAFLDADTAGFAYAPDYAIFSIPTMSVVDVTLPLPTATSTGMGMGALSGLTGYMSLGLGAKAKPTIAPVNDGEVMIGKDHEGIFVGKDGKPSREKNIQWIAPPDEIAYIRPYVFSVFPAGAVPSESFDTFAASDSASIAPSVSSAAAQQPPSMIPTSVVQVRSSISPHVFQTFSIPFPTSPSPSPPTRSSTTISKSSTETAAAARPSTAAQNASIHIPLFSSSTKSPLYMITTPVDRTAAAAEGSSIWQFTMCPWADQIDELVEGGCYADALKLLEVIDDTALPDKAQRRTRIRALNAVSQFRASNFKEALDTFFELDINPTKVVALYSEAVSGRLSVPQKEWIRLYGGPAPSSDTDSSSSPPVGGSSVRPEEGGAGKEAVESKHWKASSEPVGSTVTSSLSGVVGAGAIKRLKGAGLGLLGAQGHREKSDSDTASIHSTRRGVVRDDFRRSIEALTAYLVDRRTKLYHALTSVNITFQNQYDDHKPLSEVPVDDLFALPDAPLSALTPEELLRFAQVVDTALYKSYIIVRPGLLKNFCSIPNWCEVSEVEEDLRGIQRFAELKDLYYGKKMHAKALQLLRDLSEEVSEMEDKLRPSIIYLQKLGPEYLDHIFQYSRWIFDQDADMGFEIFLSEDVELPHQAVANYLESIDPKICVKYLEYIIEERLEETPVYYDRLAELYISMTLNAKRRNEESTRKEIYAKLLQFLNTNDKIGIDRLYGILSPTDLYEARAILLGRLGRHDQALELYVYRLHDYYKAEEYCKRIYQPKSPTSNVFLTLLRIYLRPTITPAPTDLLTPALELISRHNPRLDPVETLNLLPPLVTAEDVRAFLIEALRAPIFDTRVVRHLSKARGDQVARRLMALQTRRVRVTDSRICPQCHKRIGNSVIAVHAPRGEVTHYQCREAFSRKLNGIA